MNILCLYWEGDFRGRDFSPEDVYRLQQSVDKWINRPYQFYVLTNSDHLFDNGARAIGLKHNWPGWWSKVELHRADLPRGRTLYMDLDSHVVSDLGPLLDYSGNLVMFRSRLHKSAQNKQSWKLVSRYQAAVMLFDPGSTVSLYNRFCLNPEYYMRTYRSEQDIMGEWIPNQPTFPDRWLMKMGQLKRNLGDTIIVTGQPRNRDFRTVEWIERIAR